MWGNSLERRIKKDSKKIAKFKDKHKGKRCFIIGNGPSLKMEDLDKLHEHGEYSFAANRIYLAFENTKWRPSYYVVSDCSVLANYYSEIKKLHVKHKFIGDQTLSKYGFPPFYNSYVYRLVDSRYYPYYPDFSDDISRHLGNSWTVAYIMLQMAVYMGFCKIYLLVIDHSYAVSLDAEGKKIISQDNKNFFTDNYYSNSNIALPKLYLSEKAYIKSDIYTRLHGSRVFNATKGGKLEIFERVDFDQIFKRGAR